MDHFIPAEFNGTPLSIIDRDGQKWLTAEEIGRCLGYDESNARKGVVKLFERHGDEFTEADSRVVNLTSRDGKPRPTRIFSSEGCVMVGMFANTPRAKEFRQWAKRVLAGQTVPVAAVNPQNPLISEATLRFITDASRDMAREIGQLKDVVAAQNQALLGLYQQVDGARRGHIRALSKLLVVQDRQQKLLAGQEKREAKETILRLEAEGVPRDIIAQRTGRTLNHIRQIVFQAKQGELALGVAA